MRTMFQIGGIHGEEISEDEREELYGQGIDPDEIDFEGTDLERKVTNHGTNRRIIEEFWNESLKDESGTIPGKTIFFCASQKHATTMKRLFDDMYPQFGGHISEVITSKMERVHGKGGLLDQFKSEDMPRIAFSVDMLDTGIDIHEIVNLVFAKPIKSSIKFWQMIGRGTRVLDENPAARKAWCKEKDKFLIMDCWDNFAYFDIHPKEREKGETIPLPVSLFRERLNRMVAASENGHPELVELLKEKLKGQVDALPKNSVIVKDAASHIHKTRQDNFWEGLI